MSDVLSALGVTAAIVVALLAGGFSIWGKRTPGRDMQYTELMQDRTELRGEILRLNDEMEALRKDNWALRNEQVKLAADLAACNAKHDDAQRQIGALQQRLDRLQGGP